MRRILAVALAIAALTAAGLALFLARFDADKFRPALVQKMEQQLGRPVRVGKIALSWRRGIALELRELAVYPGPQPEGDPALRVERAFAVLKLFPLLRGDLQFSTVALIGPRLRVVRSPTGSIDVEGVTPLPAKPPAPPAPQAAPALAGQPKPASFLVRIFELKGGAVRFTDLSVRPPLELELRDVDLSVNNLSLTRPADFECRLTLFGVRPDIRGRVTPAAAGRAGLLERFRLEMELAGLRVEELNRVFPAFKEMGIGKEPEGRLVVVVDRCVLDTEGIGSLEAQIRLSGGKIQPARLAAPVRDLDLEVVARGGQLSLDTLSGKIGEGSFSAKGTVKEFPAQPAGLVQGKAENLALEEILAPAGPGEPALRGRLAGSFGGEFRGKSWPEISRSLSGEGRIRLDDVVLSDMNLLREVFDRLTLIPGLTQTLLARLPESYQEKLSARDTRFEPFELSAVAKGGVLSFREMRLATDSFALAGSGQVGLDGALQLPGRVEIEPKLSEALIRSVEELRFLTDGEGRMQIPVLVQGRLPRVSAAPDLNAVASRLFASKGEELLGELLEKVFEK